MAERLALRKRGKCIGKRTRDAWPCRAENGRYGTISDMKKDDVNAVLGRVLMWPAEAQEEAVASLRAIENELVSGGDYHATPQELKAIDEAERSGVATDDEVEAAFRSVR